MEKLTEVLSPGFTAHAWPSFILAALVMASLVVANFRSIQKAQSHPPELRQAPPHRLRNDA